ncbi:glycosyltransferase family protein [Dongia sp. agr-C8]
MKVDPKPPAANTPAPPHSAAHWIAVRDVGHYSEYRRLLTAELQALGIALEAENPAPGATLFYAAIDDHWTVFMRSALRAALGGPRTVGLFFRPGQCFLGKARAPFKRLVFAVASRLPRTSVLIILPFDIDRRLGQVASDWLYDPQLWDLHFFGMPPADAFPALDDEIAAAAQGRQVVLSLGQVELRKGFDAFVEIWRHSPEIRARYLFVSAGKVNAESRNAADAFAEAGGLLIDRRMEDEEIRHLYRHAALIWSCYNPIHDQASGILGRAVQLGVPVIVRAGSYLEKLARHLEHPTVAIPFRDSEAAAAQLLKATPPPLDAEVAATRVKTMRDRSLAVLARHLTGRTLPNSPPTDGTPAAL